MIVSQAQAHSGIDLDVAILTLTDTVDGAADAQDTGLGRIDNGSEGAINPDKLSGGSFTVSNLGNMGVESFTPVINPPQTGILGVCGTIDRVRKGKDGGIELYPAMGLSLTYDHRAVDGTPAAKFQKELGFNLENFTVLLSK